MKRRYSYKDCYRILNIEPGCTWDELRKAYKVQIQKWHPDRFTEESAEKQAADDKIKRITSANQQLVAYYRKHGRLPEPEDENTASALPRPAPRSNYAASTPPPVQTGHAFAKKSGPSLLPILILISIISYLVWSYAPYKHTSSIESKNMLPAITDSTSKTSTPIRQPVSGINATDKNAANMNSAIASGDDEIISYGSTVGAVIAIQGPPTKQIGDTWFYGESEIYFHDGKVIGWRHMPGSALKISVDNAKNSTAP